MLLIALVSLLLTRSAAAAAMPASDAAFAAQLRAGFDAARLMQASPEAAAGRLEGRLEEWLGWYGAMEAQPSFDAARMSAVIVEGMRAGPYRSFVMGESHGVDTEGAAGRKFTADLLAAGVKPGVLIREQNLYPGTAPLDALKVPVLTYKNQFYPEEDLKTALGKAKINPLVSYTGAAHTSRRAKNYFQNTLLEARWAGFGPGLKDMPTVEDSLDKHDRKPLIVAMVSEAHVVARIQQMFLAELIATGSDLPALRRNLDALLGLWTRRFALWPKRQAIAFARDPQDANVYLGMAPADRRPLELVAVAQVLQAPEFAAWLASARVGSIESLRASTGTGEHIVEIHWDVIVHSAGKPDFKRTIQGDVVRAAAGAN